MATVRIPLMMRQQLGCPAQLTLAGATVGELLARLADQHPDARPQLLGEDGDLNRFMNVYVGDEDVRVLDGLRTAVEDDDVVVLLPAIAGGR